MRSAHAVRRQDMDRGEAGFAMMSVVMGMTAIVFLVAVIFMNASAEYQGAQTQRREDTIIAGAEAMLERYAAKLTIDPLYYQNYVDEAELPRRCTDETSAHYNLVVQPGNPWYQECRLWEYPADATEYFHHPLLAGDVDITADDIAVLLAVVPPTSGAAGVQLTVVGSQPEFRQTRAITAEVRPEAISEFAFLVEGDLRFGSGAVIRGKIYVGDDLNFALSPVRGIVHRDVFAEDRIGDETPSYGAPIFASGSKGYDGAGQYLPVRSVYEDPLDFTKFWDDLTLIRDIACDGGGLCLSRTDNPSLGLTQTPTAWLLEPHVAGSLSRIRVYAAYSNSSTSCLSSEEWWWLNSQSATWTLVGTFDVPDNGAVWVDGHAIVGRPSAPSVIDESFTLYAGSQGSPKNVVIGADVTYLTGTSGTTVLGVIASDEVWVNPNAVGSDNVLSFSMALLSQGGSFHVARDCGTSGNPVLPYSGGVPTATLNTNGAMAIHQTGDVAAHFGTRNYTFDARLEYLRPPLFPLLKDTWAYANWREQPLPCWAIPGTCP